MRHLPNRACRLALCVALSVGVTYMFALTSLGAGPVRGHPASAPHSPAFRDGVVLVGFDTSTARARERAAISAAGAVDTRTIGRGVHVLHVPNGEVLATVGRLRGRAGVRYAEPDYLQQLAATPNDPSFGLQWAFQNRGQRVNGVRGTSGADEHAVPAWSLATSSRSIVIGELDTGADYTHPDLAPNIWSNPGGIGGCPAGTHGYNVIAGTCTPMDDDTVYGGHGTHVAGILGAAGNNGVGVTGLNWSATILPIKWVTSDGSGATSDLISALDWLLKAKQAGVNVRVVNDSTVFVGTAYSQALSDEIDLVGGNGILFVTAAGNTGENNDNPALRRFPCGYERPTEICVAATDQGDQLPSWANYGATTVDLGAPGNNIYSTLPHGTYGYINGSSMASPQVAGAAALILSQHDMSPAVLKADILENTDKLSRLSGRVRSGGRLDVCNALAGCNPNAPPPPALFNITPPAISGSPQQGQTQTANTGDWTGSPTGYAYQWRRCASTGSSCANVTGATSSTYTLTAADVGATMQLAVTATNGSVSSTGYSPPTAVVQSGASANTFGKTTVGASTDPADANWKRVDVFTTSQAVSVNKLTIYLQRLTGGQQVLRGVIYADQGGTPGALVAVSNEVTFGSSASSGWFDLPFPSAVALQPGAYWIGLIDGQTTDVFGLRYDSSPNSGAVAPDIYSSQPASPFAATRIDSEQISVYATYTTGPPPAAPVNTSPPTITGSAVQGQTLSALPGTWSNSPTSYAYQWRDCDSAGNNCVAISGATASSYQLAAADVGSTVRVTVTASNAGGSGSASSAATAVVVGTFGLTSVGSSSDWMVANRKRVSHFQLPVAGNVSKLTMYLQPTGTSGQQVVKGVIYADQAGTPGARLAVSNELSFSSTNSAGWYDLSFPSGVALQAGTYWIGVISGDTGNVTGFRWNNVAGARALNSDTYSTGPANPFGTATIDSEQMSVYATYTR